MRVLGVMVCYTVLTVTFATSIPSKSHCSATGFTFSVIIFRNRTGHWTSQAQLEHPNEETSLPWNIKVDHNSAQCDGVENVGLIATLSGDCLTGQYEILTSNYCTEAAPPQRPGADYELIPGLGYYKFHTSGKNWREAREICAKEGAHLLILNSEKEAGIIRNIWKWHPKVFDGWRNWCAYIGIHDEYSEGEYITVFGESLNATGYTTWAQNEPDEGTSGNSGCVGRDGTLHDTNGITELAFFCEHEL